MKPCFISFDCFNKIINLITSLDESASCLLKMLNDTNAYTDYEIFQKSKSVKTLLDILERSKKIKREWIDAGLNQNNFPEKLKNFSTDFGSIQMDFEILYQLIEDISGVEYFVDDKGTLIKQSKGK